MGRETTERSPKETPGPDADSVVGPAEVVWSGNRAESVVIKDCLRLPHTGPSASARARADAQTRRRAEPAEHTPHHLTVSPALNTFAATLRPDLRGRRPKVCLCGKFRSTNKSYRPGNQFGKDVLAMLMKMETFYRVSTLFNVVKTLQLVLPVGAAEICQ